jgi:acyl-CoA reductase-like NAD-dependent aldehyde dehydrogenase
MATWKLLFVAMKAKRGWNRIPPDQRRKMLAAAGKQVRKHGPTVANRVGTVVKVARKKR